MSDNNEPQTPETKEEQPKQQQQQQQHQDKKEKGKKQSWKNLKTPKGTRDYDGTQMVIRENLFSTISNAFKRHGAETIETPVFELKEILTGKYGEDSKLIYDLEDQGGEDCSLRYDLTVPFARYCAMNRIKQIKRYQISRVYRRDQPIMTKGRYREFYQCDFDIAGVYDPMVPESECLKLICEILDDLKFTDYTIKVNDRKLLDGMFEVCGVPAEKFRSICSAVDKMDKLSWEEVKKEMVSVKGLDSEVADKIHSFVTIKGKGTEVIGKLLEDEGLKSNPSSLAGLTNLKLLFEYIDLFEVNDKVEFDFSLARGLDYYTGAIFEAVLKGAHVGSIAGGGRYDELVGMFSGEQLPCVGFSIGIERLFSILEEKNKKSKQVGRHNWTQVLVASIDKGLLKERMLLINDLWKNDIKAELVAKDNAKIQTQLNYANQNNIPIAIIIATNELKNNTINIKNLLTSNQITVNRSEMIPKLKELLAEIQQ